MEDGTPLVLIGMMLGCGLTLLIQAYGRRKVRKAMAAVRKEEEAAPRSERDERIRDETAEMARRLAVLEQIVTDRPARLAEQIEGLRREAM
jgi:hypothetical protein